MPVTAARTVSASEYFAMPETNERYELLDGRLIMAPAPGLEHQDILIAIIWALSDYADAHGGRALLSPTDVELSEMTVVQPDAGYIVPERAGIARQHVTGPPDLVIEVLSPGSRRFHTGEKLRIYAFYGVREAWIVDPRSKTVIVREAADGRWVRMREVRFGEAIPSGIVEVGDSGLGRFSR